MEIYDWALQILTSERLEDKLFQPDCLTDSYHPPLLIDEPQREPCMRFQKRGKKEKLPKIWELGDEQLRAVCLHRFCGHELLAVEMMAHALLAFPSAPPAFRKGLVHTLKEEQEHVRLYMKRLSHFQVNLGDLPLYRHFWSHVRHFATPLHYVSNVSLTFEMANLDFAPTYGAAFLKAGDLESAQLMETIARDEIGHVSFGYHWLHRLKQTENDWQCWLDHLTPLNHPSRAKGPNFNEALRQKAGLSPTWIDQLQNPFPP